MMIGNINDAVESIKTYLHWLDVNVIMSLEVQVEHLHSEIQRVNDILHGMAKSVEDSVKWEPASMADFLVDVYIRRNRLNWRNAPKTLYRKTVKFS